MHKIRLSLVIMVRPLTVIIEISDITFDKFDMAKI